MLTWLESGERVVMVDATLLGDDWRGWDAATDGHVLSALDISRRAGGHDVALPVCTERVADFIARRRVGGASLAAGEVVTVGVSLLRGCAELLDRPQESGEWWLTEAGRPVLAADASDRGVVEGAAALLAEVSAWAPDPIAWADAVAAITAARPTRDDIERAEHGLFRVADALPLATAPSISRTARELAAVDRPDAIPADEPARTGLWHALARHVDSDLADLVSRTTTSIWRGARASEGSRKRPWVVAGAAAAAVLAVGLMWPTGGLGAATADTSEPNEGGAQPTPEVSTSVADEQTGEPQPTPVASEVATTEAAAAAGDLLDRRRACDGEEACLREVMLDPAATVSAGPIDLPADQRSIVLLDDFGGVAVLRVDAAARDQESQLVVIARIDGEWLLRDVHDTAQQP